MDGFRSANNMAVYNPTGPAPTMHIRLLCSSVRFGEEVVVVLVALSGTDEVLAAPAAKSVVDWHSISHTSSAKRSTVLDGNVGRSSGMIATR